jgi:hypothetical protein
MPSEGNEKQMYREVAQSYAAYVRRVMSLYDFVERGGEDSESEYYIKCFREPQKSKQLERKRRALEYVRSRRRMISGPLRSSLATSDEAEKHMEDYHSTRESVERVVFGAE